MSDFFSGKEELLMPLLSGLLIVLSLVIEAVRRISTNEVSVQPLSGRAAALLLFAFLSLLILPFIGFYFATLILFLGGAALLGEKSVKRYLVGALVWTVVVHLLFVEVLQVPLPAGSLFV